MFRFVVSRVGAHRLLLGAVLLTVVLTTAVLTTLTAFSASVGDAGVRRGLEGGQASRAVLDVTVAAPPDDRAATDTAVRKAARGAFDGLPVRTSSSARSGPYALPGRQRPDGEPDLTLFASLDRERVRVTGGRWPGAPARSGGRDVRVEAAVPQRVARALDLQPGDTLDLTGRLDADRSARVVLTGVYELEDPDAPYWRMDPLEGEGVRTRGFTTYGPFAVVDAAFGDGLLRPAETRWQTDADFTGLTAAELTGLREQAVRTTGRFAAASGVEDAVAGTELPQVVEELERSLAVGRSTLLVAAVQLAVLAALALLLVARLLAVERTAETALLRARGASRAHLARTAVLEALLVTVPGALLAPLLAGPLTGLLLGEAGPGVRLPGAAWQVAALNAVVCAGLLAVPAVRGERRVPAPRRRRAAAALRGGADLALVALAVLAYGQLARRGAGEGVLTASADGTGPGVDPVLVVAPALALLAGTVVVLRLLPLLARLGERRAARSRGLGAALTGWQFGRRPGHGAGPVLLLVLAVAMGVFAVGQAASWDRSQRDQADFRTGAEVGVAESSVPPFGQGGLLSDVEGVRTAAPVAREEFTVDDRQVQLLATDTRAAGGMLRLRDDLAGPPLPTVVRPLAEDARAGSGGVELPSGTQKLMLSVRIEGAREQLEDDLTAIVEDRFGVPYRLALGGLPADGRAHTLTAGLAGELTGGGTTRGAPAGPLRLTGLRLGWTALARSEERTLDVLALRAADADGTARTVEVPAGREWEAALDPGTPEAEKGAPGAAGRVPPTVPGVGGGGGEEGPLTLRYTTGSGLFGEISPGYVVGEPQPYGITAWAGSPPDADAVVPVVATDAFLAASRARVGDTLTAPVAGQDVRLRITGAVRALPTTTAPRRTASDGGALLADLATLDARLQAAGAEPLDAEDWWVDAEDGQAAAVTARLTAHPAFDGVQARDRLAAALRADPLGSSARTALTAVTVAAAVLAATGFAVSAAGARRERHGEFAVLRALGAPRRTLGRVQVAEQGLVVALSLAAGVGLGVLLTRLVVPLVVLTQDAARPVPDVLVTLPPGRLVPLLAVVLAAPLLLLAATALRVPAPAATLRTERGE